LSDAGVVLCVAVKHDIETSVCKVHTHTHTENVESRAVLLVVTSHNQQIDTE